jgi:TetR/AcrR family transcriptional regulator
MARPRTPPAASATRDRLIAAARQEFALRGYDGAKVDRIAARARVNKAMLYYHFHSKTELYRSILLEQFSGVATAVSAVRQAGGAPEAQLRRFIETVAERGLSHPHFPPMWLREIADGGRHLSPPIVGQMKTVVGTLAAILADGCAAGVFRPVNPFVTQVGIVGPLLFFMATEPVRERFHNLAPSEVIGAGRNEVVAHVIATTLAAVAASPARPFQESTSRRERP